MKWIEKKKENESVGSDDGSFDSFDDYTERGTVSTRRSGIYNGSRSDDSYNSSGTSLFGEFGSNSWATKVTARELINDIKLHAERNQNAPEYVPRLDELPPHLISWNSKLPKLANMNDPPINILGCHHSIELILAKADKRLRNQKKILATKKVKVEEKITQIDEGIKLKFSRAERYAAIFAQKQRQIMFLRIVAVSHYILKLNTAHKEQIELVERSRRFQSSALIIKETFLNWFTRHIFRKYQLGFKKVMQQYLFPMKLSLRINLKRRAVHKITTFFKEFKARGVNKMKKVVHKFLSAVRFVQKMVKSFIQCRNAKVEAVRQLWDKMETKYISKMLEAREAKKAKNLNAKAKETKSINFDLFDDKTKIEMKKQAKMWNTLDTMMEKKVLDLKFRKIIVDETLEQQIAKLMIPYDVKCETISNMIGRWRKDFYGNQKRLSKKKSMTSAGFKEAHAKALLFGSTEVLNRKIDERLRTNRFSSTLAYKPFRLFQCGALSERSIYYVVKDMHKERGTFTIRIEDFAETKKRQSRHNSPNSSFSKQSTARISGSSLSFTSPLSEPGSFNDEDPLEIDIPAERVGDE